MIALDALTESTVGVVVVWAGPEARVVEKEEVERAVNIGTVFRIAGAGDASRRARLAQVGYTCRNILSIGAAQSASRSPYMLVVDGSIGSISAARTSVEA